MCSETIALPDSSMLSDNSMPKDNVPQRKAGYIGPD